MFDTHIVQAGPARVDVHEHRAPTDESVRLLKEMESAAQEKITKGIRLDNNDIKLVLNHYIEPMTQDIQVIYYFMLNNKRINGKVSIPSYIETTEKIDMIIHDIARTFATQLLLTPANLKDLEGLVK